MILRLWIKVLGVFIVGVVCTNSFLFSRPDTNEALIIESDATLKAINKALKFFENHLEVLNDDVVFGLLLAKSNILWAADSIETLPWKDILIEKLVYTIGICDRILSKNKDQNPVLEEDFWRNGIGDITFGNLNVKDNSFNFTSFNSCQSLNDYAMRGVPENSDHCLRELFDVDCDISYQCWVSEMNEDFDSGYKTSHRLIYLQTAAKLGCDKKNKKTFFNIKERKRRLCQKMFLEAKLLYSQPFLWAVRDLFLEQIALCGYEGYGEFASAAWRREVRSWAKEKGCYEQEALPEKCSLSLLPKKSKKSDVIISDCHTHVTAVAVSALTFYFRFILSTASTTL